MAAQCRDSTQKVCIFVSVISAWHVGGHADISAAGFILMGAFSRTIEPIIPSPHSLTEHLSLHTEQIIINYRPHRSELNVGELTLTHARGQRATEEDMETDCDLNIHGRLRVHDGSSRTASLNTVSVQNGIHSSVRNDTYVYCKLR